MVKKPAANGRERGHIQRRGNSYQVLVYAGLDPLTGRELRLTESTTDEAKAKEILKRFRAQVDEQRHARTKASFRVVMEAWLRVHEIDETTREGYEAYARLYINPAFGDEPIGKITARLLEEFYAELRRCRVRCDGRPMVDHRVEGPHECRTIRHRRPPGRPTTGGYPAHDCAAAGCKVIECPPHQCRPLSAGTIRRIHVVISATLAAAMREELRHMRDYRVAATANRSVVGIMNEFSRLAVAHRDRAPCPDLTDLAQRLATTPCSPLYGRNVSPDRELAAFLHTATSTCRSSCSQH